MTATMFTFTRIDGPLAISGTRAERVRKMADDLIRLDATALEADAIRALMATGKYSSFEIMRHIDDARQLGQQDLVAREMSKP